ncbi:ABC transporter ATP-binding protein [candidate division WWE3 bacterium]|nr:ABC transporter ATP-binding protein [candidate division WWE3 bacterium]
MSKNAISIKNLTYEINGTTILQGASIDIGEKELVSIKGPSGCGKTTLLSIIAGLTTPQSGEISIFNQKANTPHIVLPPYKRSIGLLFQDLALWPHMSGYDQLKYVFESTSNSSNDFERRMSETCERIGLPKELLEKRPSQLSRGQQQRLAIARAVIHHPKILLLDEPLTALDQDLRQQFATFLATLKNEAQTTIVIVSHDLLPDIVKPDHEYLYSNEKLIKNF